jgi:hypothetical protein
VPGLFHCLPREREIAATSRTDAILGQASSTCWATLEVFRHRGSRGGQPVHPSPSSGRRRVRPCGL